MPYLVDNELANRFDNDFTYHAPFGDQAERYGSIREAGRQFAYFLATNCPQSRELSTALTKIDEAVFWGNAAIARNEHESEDNTLNRLRERLRVVDPIEMPHPDVLPDGFFAGMYVDAPIEWVDEDEEI